MKLWNWLFVGLLFFVPLISSAALCGLPANPDIIVAVDARYGGASHLQALQGVNIHSEGEVRSAAYTAALGYFRGIHGVGSAPVNSVLLLTYQDGSYECAMVASTMNSDQGRVIVGSQHAAGGGGGGGGDHPLSYYFYAPTWEHVCDDYYSDGVYVGSYCFYQIA